MVAPAILGAIGAGTSLAGGIARLVRGKDRNSAEKLRRAGIAQASDLGQSVAASQPGVSPALAARQGVLAASQAAPEVLARAAQLESRETGANTQRRDRIVGGITGALGQGLASAGGVASVGQAAGGGAQQPSGPIESPNSSAVATGLGATGSPQGAIQPSGSPGGRQQGNPLVPPGATTSVLGTRTPTTAAPFVESGFKAPGVGAAPEQKPPTEQFQQGQATAGGAAAVGQEQAQMQEEERRRRVRKGLDVLNQGFQGASALGANVGRIFQNRFF